MKFRRTQKNKRPIITTPFYVEKFPFQSFKWNKKACLQYLQDKNKKWVNFYPNCHVKYSTIKQKRKLECPLGLLF